MFAHGESETCMILTSVVLERKGSKFLIYLDDSENQNDSIQVLIDDSRYNTALVNAWSELKRRHADADLSLQDRMI